MRSVDQRGELFAEQQSGEAALQLGGGGARMTSSSAGGGEVARRGGQAPHRGEFLNTRGLAQAGEDEGFCAWILTGVQGAPRRVVRRLDACRDIERHGASIPG